MQRSGWLSEMDTGHKEPELIIVQINITSSRRREIEKVEPPRCTSTNNFSKDKVFNFDYLVNNCKNIRLIYNNQHF